MTSLDGKTFLVTGATSGIGLEASVKLASAGAHVVVVGRNPAKAERAADEVRRRAGAGAVSQLACDFASQRSVRELAQAFLARHDRLDVLVNNAGTVSDRRRVTEDGIEITFAVNHLGYFLLTCLLLDRIKRCAPARIVNVASIGHRHGDLDFDDVGYEKGGYFIMKAYQRSKLANVLFTSELARRLAGSGVTVNSLHPGGVATNIWSKAPWYARPVLEVMKRVLLISPEQGGETIVYLATSPEVEGRSGGYYERNRLVEPAPLASDEMLARELWQVSEKMTGMAARVAQPARQPAG